MKWLYPCLEDENNRETLLLWSLRLYDSSSKSRTWGKVDSFRQTMIIENRTAWRKENELFVFSGNWRNEIKTTFASKYKHKQPQSVHILTPLLKLWEAPNPILSPHGPNSVISTLILKLGRILLKDMTDPHKSRWLKLMTITLVNLYIDRSSMSQISRSHWMACNNDGRGIDQLGFLANTLEPCKLAIHTLPAVENIRSYLDICAHIGTRAVGIALC